MKTNKLIAVVLLAALATGCSKDDSVAEPNAQNVIKIHASAMGGNGGTKLSLDPGANGEDPNDRFDVKWVAGESIKFFGSSTDIVLPVEGSEGDYYINQAPFEEAITSLYPGESFDGNEVDVNADGIVMHNLEIKFEGDRQRMAFPMVATAAANATDFNYEYLCGGVRLTLDKQSGANMNVASLRIVAQSTDEVVNLGNDDGIIAKWATEGPWVPFNMVGDNEDEVDVKYSSVMYFTLSDVDEGTNEYKIIYAGGDQVQFCVPITISSMNKLNITGYDQDGRQLFQVHKTFSSNINVERGRMYNLPVINID